MTPENAGNRAWLLRAHVDAARAVASQPSESDTLLYYLEQLEAEVRHVRDRLGALGVAVRGRAPA
jgi:hypothetical protein